MTKSTTWEPTGNGSDMITKPTLVTRIRLSKEGGAALSPDDASTQLLLVVNQEDELLAPLSLARFRMHGLAGSLRFAELVLTPPLLLVEGMRLELCSARSDFVAEREVRDVSHEEAITWFSENARSKAYPARWYGTAEADVMRAKIDNLVSQARQENLDPHFVQLPNDGSAFDTCCRACSSDDPERGPFNAQLLAKRDDALMKLFFAFPIVCGVCVEDEEKMADLQQEIWDCGRGLAS